MAAVSTSLSNEYQSQMPAPKGAGTDRFFAKVVLSAAVLVLVILALIAWSTASEAWPVFRKEGLGFILSNRWNPSKGEFGGLAFIFGTLVISLIAIVIAVPVSVGIALLTTEVAPRWLRKPLVYLVDLLAVVPSVVFGLWGINVLAPKIKPVYKSIADSVHSIPILNRVFVSQGAQGRSIMTAGIVLAIMITPVITSLVREIFATVPSALKEAAYGLGATRWEMIRGAVISHSKSGMISSVMIGLGRAMGETIAVALVIGSSPQITSRLFSSGDAMASVIANNFGEADGTFRAALIGLGVVLFLITIVIGVSARAVLNRSATKLSS